MRRCVPISWALINARALARPNPSGHIGEIIAHPALVERQGSINKARFEAFSDAVFAFAATLLVLGFVLPVLHGGDVTDARVLHAFAGMWTNLLAYILSFAVIGIMWQNHHALFRMVRDVDRSTVFYNLLLLAITAFIPFVTSALGTYPQLHVTTFAYGVVLSLSGTAYNVLLMHLIRSHAFAPEVSETAIRQTVVAYRTGWITYIVAMLTALILPVLSFALYIAVTVYYLIPRGLDSDLNRNARS